MEATARYSIFDKNAIIRTSIRSALISFVISLVLVLLFAFVVKMIEINSSMIEIVNQAIKAISVFLGVLFGISDRSRWLLKGILSGILFAVLSSTVFTFLGANMTLDSFWVDLGLSVVSGVIGSLIAMLKK